MKKTDIAWIAGFFEGEGYAGCYHNRRRTLKNYYVLRASIAQREKKPLEFIKKLLGYGSLFRRRSGYKNSWCWYYDVANLRARKFLKLISPYLKSDYKRGQVKNALRKDKQFVGQN